MRTIILMLSLVSLSAPARTRHKATTEEQIQSCLTNKDGIAVSLKTTLNERKNPRAENVKATDWAKYCQCYTPKAQALEEAQPKGNLPRDVYQKLTTDLANTAEACANESIPNAKPTPAVTPTAKPDPRFDPTIKNCQTNPKGYLENLKIHLNVQKSPRAANLDNISPEKYCGCYVNSLRHKLGDDLALKVLTTYPATNNNQDIIRISKAKDETLNTCAAEQIPFN